MKTVVGILAAAMLWGQSANATPSAAIAIEDKIIAANARSYFVVRTTHLFPNTYYAKTVVTDFVELSIWDGSVRARCNIHTREHTLDANSNSEDWQVVERPGSRACQPDRKIKEAGASKLRPIPPKASLAVKQAKVTKNGKKLATGNYVEKFAYAPFTQEQATYPLGEDLTKLHWDYCEMDQTVFRAPPAADLNWRFLQVNCWAGNSDESGVNFILPISDKTWDK